MAHLGTRGGHYYRVLLSADIIFDTRVVFTSLNVTRPTSHLFYISRCYHDRDRVIFTLARSHEYFTEGLSLSAAISGRKTALPFPGIRITDRTIEPPTDCAPRMKIKRFVIVKYSFVRCPLSVRGNVLNRNNERLDKL